jgi:hypothetical protein
MLANYHMKVLKTYNKEMNDEAAAKLKTQNEMNAKARAKFDRVKGLYKGKGEQLHRAYRWNSIYYNRRTKQVAWSLSNLNSNNFKHAFQSLGNNLYTKFFKRHVDVAWLINNYDRGFVACSEEKKMEDPLCLKMLGYSIYMKTAFRMNKVDNKLFNPELHRYSPERMYYALMSNSEKPEEAPKFVNLTANWGAAVAKYNKMCQTRKKNPTEYNVCIVGCTWTNYWWYPRSKLAGTEIRHDVYTLLAKWFISKNKDAFSKVKTDEKSLKIKTRVEWTTHLKESLEKMKKAYTGDREMTHKAKIFRLVEQNKFNLNHVQRSYLSTTNVRYAVDRLATIALNRFIKTFEADGKKRFTWAIISQEGGPIYISEDMKSKDAQRLLGSCIIKNWMWAPKELSAMDGTIALGDPKYHYFALLKDDKGEITKMDLSLNLAAAKAQFNGMFPKNRNLWKHSAGLIGHTAKYGWRANVGKSAEPTNSWLYLDDVNMMPVQFAQKELKKLLEVSSDCEELGLETRKSVLERVKESLDKATKFFNAASAERLQTNYLFSTVYIRPRKSQLALGPNYRYHMRQSVRTLYMWLHNNYIKNKGIETSIEFIIFANKNGIVYSSIEDLKDEKVRTMIGYALQTRRLWLPEELRHSREMHKLSKTKGWTFIACKKGSKDVEKFFTREQSEFVQRRAAIKADKKYDAAFFWRTGVRGLNFQMFKVDTKRTGRTQRWPHW